MRLWLPLGVLLTGCGVVVLATLNGAVLGFWLDDNVPGKGSASFVPDFLMVALGLAQVVLGIVGVVVQAGKLATRA